MLKALRQTSDAAAAHQVFTLDYSGLPSAPAHDPLPSPLLSLADLQMVAMDIKNTLTAAISDLKMDLRAVASHLEHVESAAMTHGTAMQQVQQVTSAHAQHLIDMHHHIENFDNSGQGHNLRFQGISESVEGPQLQQVIWALCNTLLGRQPDAPLEMEHCRRALRP